MRGAGGALQHVGIGAVWAYDPGMELRAEDLVVDTYTAGFGTPRRVRVTHMPTGVAVECEDRSALRAREEALRRLRAELEAHADVR
jgi:protein subunit release factor A